MPQHVGVAADFPPGGSHIATVEVPDLTLADAVGRAWNHVIDGR
jgi:hypothetical protein